MKRFFDRDQQADAARGVAQQPADVRLDVQGLVSVAHRFPPRVVLMLAGGRAKAQ